MIEYDFLTPFEEEVEREASVDHTLHDEERALFLQAMSKVEQHNEQIRSQFTTKPNPNKKLVFEALKPLLIRLAEDNCCYLRIDDDSQTQIEVELRCATILGGSGEYALYGAVLARIFDTYRDFSLDISPDNHVRLKFTVPLFDVVKLP